MPLPSALKISGIARVPQMYLIMWTSVLPSSLSGVRTLVVKNAMAVQVSGLAFLGGVQSLGRKVVKLHSLVGL
jgi:hypothetical protein